MITERKENLADVESQSYIEKLLEKYFITFVGDRENGNLYVQEGRQPSLASEEVRSIDQLAAGS